MIRYLVMTIRKPQFQDSIIQEHQKYLSQLKEDGFLEMSGPFTDKSGGAYLVAATSLEAAKEIAFSDPVHTSGSSEVSVYEWDAK